MPRARILAVDDQRYFRELMEGLLTEEGYTTQTASSAEEALRILESDRFDVVLTDLVMPGVDGGELVQRIKARDPDQEIVVVTGVIDVKTAVDAMKLGASDYLLKPFDRKTLSLALEGILQRRRLRDEHAKLLAENIEFISERSLFERALGLFAQLALEPLAERIVEDLCLETRAQGGLLWVGGGADGVLRLAAARGLVRIDEEPEKLGPDDLPPEIQAESEVAADPSGELAPLYVPLRREGRLVGLVRLTDKLGGEEFDPVDRACAERLGASAALALANALRFRALERRSAVESSGAHTFDYFQGVVRNEIEKASRFGRTFSLMTLDLGPRDALRRTRGEAELRRWREGVLEQLTGLLRATDLVAVQGERRLTMLLVESDALGAAVLKRRTRQALAESELFTGLDAESRPALHVGLATYPGDGTQLESLLRALDERVEEERRSPVDRLGLEGMPLASCLEALLSCGRPERPETAEQIARLVLGEVARRPRERGILFAAPGVVLADAVREGLESLRGSAPRTDLVVVSGADRGAPDELGVSWVSPQRVSALPPFLLRFGEGPAYVMVREARETRDSVQFYHSNDRSVVEHLAFRLQRELAVPGPLESPWPLGGGGPALAGPRVAGEA